MSRKFEAGTVAWARPDPTNQHDDRPVIVLAHESHPYSATDCTVMCLGTSADRHDPPTPVLEPEHVSGISFQRTTYLEPWALYTVQPNVIDPTTTGELTESGERLVKKALVALLDL